MCSELSTTRLGQGPIRETTEFGGASMLRVTESILLQDHEISERFVRAIGPRGQNMRREATAVELRLDIATSSLPPEVKERLRTIAKSAVTKDGTLVVVGRVRRSQIENRTAAHARLLALLQRAAIPPKKRRRTEPPQVTREQRLASKKRSGALKASRSTPR
jgi:ribosome-associated protein